MKLLIINNLSAGTGGSTLYDFIRAFSKDGDEVVIRCTDGTTPAETFLSDAGDFDIVVVAGGDGTVSSVSYALRNTGIPILPFPSGTANLLSLNLDAPIEPHAFAALARARDTLDFDIGELEFDGRKVGFSIIAGAGYDANIMVNAAKMKASLGESAYFAAALANPNPVISHFTITLDGKVVETDGIAILLVNFGKMQFDLSVTPENNPRDGLLEIVVAKVQNAVQLLPALFAAMLDREGGFPTRGSALEIYTAKEVGVVADPPLDIQYDGELARATTPLYARALKGAVRTIVDKNSEHIQSLGRL